VYAHHSVFRQGLGAVGVAGRTESKTRIFTRTASYRWTDPAINGLRGGFPAWLPRPPKAAIFGGPVQTSVIPTNWNPGGGDGQPIPPVAALNRRTAVNDLDVKEPW